MAAKTQTGSGFVTAWHTLTRLPVPGRDAGRFDRALPWFPAVGILLGAAAALVVRAGAALGWSVGGAVLGVSWLAWATGGLHLDGLADTVDGLAGGRTPGQRLAIMKDSRIGAMGAIALGLVLLAKTAALARLGAAGAWCWIPVACLGARYAQVQLACRLPYARPEGGTAAPFFRDATPRRLLQTAALALVLAAGLAGRGGMAALALAAGGAAVGGAWLHRRLGGITGDSLGFVSELVETALLLALAAATGRLPPW